MIVSSVRNAVNCHLFGEGGIVFARHVRGGAYCVYPHAFVTPAIDENDWLSSSSGCFIPGERTLDTP